ncbi:hypothetical protein [Actinoallomurus sp. NPDC050550]|uniref:hypothetical protein n=1 Tax=Actinoallomurus sp. NPDC050550 TaxID=3154937 RepID=UPI0033F4D25D
MSWPPWWLILMWVTLVPIGIRMLIHPTKGWRRPKQEWAENHPGDSYSSGWLAQTELQALIGLGLVVVSTLAWVFNAYDSAHKDPPSWPKTPTQIDSAGAVAVMPDSYEPTGKGLRLIWHSYGDGTRCPFDHVKVDETATRVMVTVYETAGTPDDCNEESTTSGRWGDGESPYTTRRTDVSLHDPLGGRAVTNGDGDAIQTLEQSQRK